MITTIRNTLLTLILLATAQTHAALDLAQEPLFTKGLPAPANVLLLIDDSWSMRWEVIYNKGTLTGSSSDRLEDCGGGFCMWRQYLNFEASASNTAARGSRANQFGTGRAELCPGYNVLAFNPNIIYTPWKGPDLSNDGAPFKNRYPSTADVTAVNAVSPDSAELAEFYPHRGDNEVRPNCTFGATGDPMCYLRCTGDSCSAASVAATTSGSTKANKHEIASHFFIPWNDADADGEFDGPTVGFGAIDFPNSECPTDSPVTVASLPRDENDASFDPTKPGYTRKNYANWFTYYRRRYMTAVRAASEFVDLSDDYVGIAGINDILSGFTTNLAYPITDLTTTKTGAFSTLYSQSGFGTGTPSRSALTEAGNYFKNTYTMPYSCAVNATVLLSDGIYNDTFSVIDHDADTHANTLADAAYSFFKTDQKPTVVNNVSQEDLTAPTYQHMRTFTLSLGLDGTIDPESDLSAVTWPAPSSNATKVDDLLHAAYNTRGKYFQANNPQQLIDGFVNALTNINVGAGSSASAAGQSDIIGQGAQFYQAFYQAGWAGDIIAKDITPPAQPGGTFTITNAWSAANVLATNISNGVQRLIITGDGSTAGKAFSWNGLSNTAQVALHTNISGVNDGLGSDRVDFLRGASVAGMRSRSLESVSQLPNVLGDFVHAAPIVLTPPRFYYDDAGLFAGLSDAERTSYGAFKTAQATRPAVVFVGSNAGMLHGFTTNAMGTLAAGSEVLAYVPTHVIPALSKLTSDKYQHQYYVDGPLNIGDGYDGQSGTWKTILAAGLGAGFKGAYALDVTSPGAFAANSTNLIAWELFPQANASDDFYNLGHIIGEISIGRMANGQWVAAFGNGLNGNGNAAVLYIVDLFSGSLLAKKSVTVSGQTGDNGLASPALADTNLDGIVDYIYAGDLRGNMWKFDVTSASKVVSTGNSERLFTTLSPEGNRQPITSRPALGLRVPGGEMTEDGIMVLFGTGKYLEDSDVLNVAQQDTQTFYGIWDEETDPLNPAALPSARPDRAADNTLLLEQTFLSETADAALAQGGTSNFDTRSSTTTPIVDGDATQTGIGYWWRSDNTTGAKGWYIDLKVGNTKQGERVINNPRYMTPSFNDSYANGRIIFTTLIPLNQPCEGNGTGWLVELDPTDGKVLYKSFDLNADGITDSADNLNSTDTAASAIKFGDTSIPSMPLIFENSNPEDADDPDTVEQTKIVTVSGTGSNSGNLSGATNNLSGVGEPGPGSGTGSPDTSTRTSWRELNNVDANR